MLEKITNDLKEAMKNQDKFKLSVIRMLKGAIQMEETKLSKDESLDDVKIIAIIKKSIKQREDSILEYTKYNRLDDIKGLEDEISILKEYLPKQLSDDEIDIEVKEAINKLEATNIKDMGKVMKYLTDKIGVSADLSVVSSKVKDILTK
jgi:uncharacterized protein YqeY